MPKTYDRLIIGAGTTASVYLSFYPPGDGEDVGIIGLDEPWGFRGTHYMGQPPHLLMLPQPNPQSPFDDDIINSNEEDLDINLSPKKPFLRSDQYAQQLITMPQHKQAWQNVKYRTAIVYSITQHEEVLKVAYKYRDDNTKKYLYTRQVIIASGPGSARDKRLPNDAPENSYHTGDVYLSPSTQLRGKIVAVEGGSATAAWSVEKALSLGATQVYWYVRNKSVPDQNRNETPEERFSGAFPAGGRNDWLRDHKKVKRFLGDFDGDATTWVPGDDGRQLKLTFKNGEFVLVDQFVAALGALQTADYLGDLRTPMIPIVDFDGHVHPDKDIVLGYRSPDNRPKILVLGAGVYKMPKPKGQVELYAKGNEYLPRAARPPEGIPTIISSIAALTRYLGGCKSRWIDINLGNFTDLDEHFKVGTARAFSHLLCQRLQLDIKSIDSLAQFIVDQVIGARILKMSPYGITTQDLMELDKSLRNIDEGNLEAMYQAWIK